MLSFFGPVSRRSRRSPAVALAAALLSSAALASNDQAQSVRVAWIGGHPAGGPDGEVARLRTALGPRYDVRAFGSSTATVTQMPTLFEVPPELAAFAPQVLLVHLGPADASPEAWDRNRDGFVPAYRGLLGALQALPSQPKVYAVLPAAEAVAADDPRRRRLESGLIPLARQAAREAGAGLISLEGTGGAADLVAETVAATVADPAERRRGWTVLSSKGPAQRNRPPAHAVDGKPETFWQTEASRRAKKPPHELQVDLGSEQDMVAFRFLPRQDGLSDGRVGAFALYLSRDGRKWGRPAATGRLLDAVRPSWVRLPAPTRARFFRFEALSEATGGRSIAVAEIDLVVSKQDPGRP